VDDSLPLAGPHWSFAIGLYGRPGVAEACLWLQDELGVDVNVLLIALFAASERGLALEAHDIAALDRTVESWRREVVLEVRAIRRRLKAGPPPAPSSDTDALRDLVKRAELRAEQIEQAVLARWLDENTARAARGTVDPGEVLRRVVAFFAQQSASAATGPVEQQSRTAVAAILQQLAPAGPAR
jgi:uncharacterized protein (TIGR02444 family)